LEIAVRNAQTLFSRPAVLARSTLALLFATFLATLPVVHAAPQVLCHYTYGGETRTLTASPVASPYAVKAIDIGSFFHMRVVFQDKPAALASIKTYVYGDRDDSPVLIHQATFAYPVSRRGDSRYGFSGLQSVYEPMRDGELQYWCQMAMPSGGRAAS
jgi:hypothetical protein